MLRKRLTILWSILWAITGLATLFLLVITLNLRSRALSQEAAGFVGTITGTNSAVYLYERPNTGSRIVTVLDLGAFVFVSDSNSAGSTQWYYVNSGEATGWLPASRVSRDPP